MNLKKILKLTLIGVIVFVLLILYYQNKNVKQKAATQNPSPEVQRNWNIKEVISQLKGGMINPEFEKFFDRDPERHIPQEKNIIVAPADGKIISIRNKGEDTVIRISLSLLDVHVQRIPISGKVLSVERIGSGFLPASASGHLNNVQAVTVIDTEIGQVTIKQITGFLARRIKTFVKPGDEVIIGSRLGRILLGSTVIVTLPNKVNLLVRPNQNVMAGETIIARF